MKFRTKGLLLSKEYRKAANEWTDQTGKKVEALPKRWYAHLAVGDMPEENKRFFDGDIRVAAVQITRQEFAKLSEQKVYDCVAEQRGKKFSLLDVKGMDIVEDDEDDDEVAGEDEDSDEV